MHKLLLFTTAFFYTFISQAQTYTSGLTATGSGGSTNVRLGGANALLVNTVVDLGTFTFGFQKSTTNYLSILNNGNVGINNSAPTYRFDVAGTTRLNGLQTFQGTSASDAAPGGGTSSATTTFASSDGVAKIEIRATSAIGNAFFGYQAGQKNTTAGYNSFIGYQAGASNTTGDNNNFIGYQSGYNNTTGRYNVALGNQSGLNNLGGNYNSFINYQAGYNNTSGNANNFIGYGAGFSNTTGSYNNFLGTNAGYANLSGMGNVFISRYAGSGNTTGGYNSFVGYGAGSNNTIGSNNIAMGLNAGYFIASGATATILNNSVMLGQNSRPAGDNESNQIVIGSDAIGMGSNTAVIGNSSTTATGIYGNLLLGSTTNSTYKLDVTGTGRFTGSVGIGTANINDVNFKLFVETGIRTRKVKVDVVTWPDYVFEDTYQLPAIAEVEKFIKKYKHLEGILSEGEVKKDGVDLGENQVTLLKKIEELTLYIIDQNKITASQQDQLNDQTKTIAQQQLQLAEVQKQVKELADLLRDKKTL
jgi:hypothetical protein